MLHTNEQGTATRVCGGHELERSDTDMDTDTNTDKNTDTIHGRQAGAYK